MQIEFGFQIQAWKRYCEVQHGSQLEKSNLTIQVKQTLSEKLSHLRIWNLLSLTKYLRRWKRRKKQIK